MKVLKFGGSSVGSPARIKEVIEIVVNSDRNNGRIAVVFSAFQGVTDTLINLANLASCGNQQYHTSLEELKERHFEAVRELIPVKNQSHILTNILFNLKELSDILHGVSLVKELTGKTLDHILSFGERLSSYIISEALKERGVDAEFLDSRDLLICDDNFGAGRINFEITDKNIEIYFKSHSKLQIITGFIASTKRGETITLGRGGSDYTASIFGAALQVEEIEIWTDVDGVMTADPRKVKGAFSVPSLTYDEAMEMSHFGAKVIYPPTMQPAMDRNVPIRIMNTMNPSFPGTLIGRKSENERFAIKGISSIDNISMLLIQGSGMIGVAGISKRVFGSLANMNINVILISQASSEHSICIAVMPDSAVKAKRCIEKEFKYEIQAKIVNEVSITNDLSIVTVVGAQMRQTPGNAGKFFQSLGRSKVNIIAIAQGSSELDISAVIAKSDLNKALNAIHDTYFNNGHKPVNIFLAGTGLIGSELLSQIERQQNDLFKSSLLKIEVIAVANSRKMLFENGGIKLKQWKSSLSGSKDVAGPDTFVDKMISMSLQGSVFVDCTPGESYVTKYPEILAAGISVVTPNKKGNSSKMDFYNSIRLSSKRGGSKFLYETNVGAGLPVVGTLKDLISCGDKIISVEGVLSGTLSYIFNTYDGSVPFSELVKDAQAKGYTEPDPRDDLNGMDVARKLLILARESGFKMEMEEIQLESLIPEGVSLTGNVEEFYKEMKGFDSLFEQKLNMAKNEGKVLRYIASLKEGKASVSLKAVDSSHPFFPLKANDNIVAFSSKYYSTRPLVIQGPGAGAEVTACGVFADILKSV
ncbi:MAG: bifunctional aspartate kinase/homoserine dehydrogenase I [Bacteroidales bacterium]|nr:bifunctional aspartate kinase/homoserine dehydrogenase I [Bacteroidales bacterium]